MIRIPGKIPIIIHPLFWLVAIFIGWMWTFTLVGTLLATVVIVISVLFHEMGHAITGIAFGQKTRIELAVFGGFTYREGRKLKLWEEFFVVLNGPLAGFLLFLIAYTLLHQVKISNPMLQFILQFAYIANFFWTIINLVPILPLDGGHLLSIILEGIFGFKGIKLALIIGLVIGIGTTIFFFAIGQWLIGALFLILTFESFRSLKYYRHLSEPDRDTEIQTLFQSANTDLEGGNTEKATEKLKGIRDKTKEGLLFTMATQQLAQIYKDQKKYEEAYQLLKPLKMALAPESLPLFHFLAYMNKDYEAVVEMGNHCYQVAPSYETALINALAHAALGHVDPAVGWLECAIREGLPSVEETIQRIEWEPIRRDAKFQEFLRQQT